MDLPSLQLLDAVATGKILFKDQSQLTEHGLRQKVYWLRDKENLPLKKIGGRYLISLRKLNEWVESKGL